MDRAQAMQVKNRIEREYPGYSCELRQYDNVPGWIVLVKNTRTGEEFGVSDPDTWQERLGNMQGLQGGV
jgi:hypothetical protein